MNKPLLEVKNLHTSFFTRNGIVKAVRGVSYTLNKGETLGIVGESGSGKSVTQYSILGLIPSPPGKIEKGEAFFEGLDLLKCSTEELRQIRGRHIGMIFQDPMTCLNPYLQIGEQLMEVLFVHFEIDRKTAKEKAYAMLDEVGILDVKRRFNDYPHQFSGGMRQRVMIAMALIAEPKLLIADEPTTALDVTVEAQILDLIKKEQKRRGMSVIYITHNLGVVAGIADRLNVMYAGEIVESGLTENVFQYAQHPYTKALLASIPSAHKRGERLYTIKGLPPHAGHHGLGCAFANRCDFTTTLCTESKITLKATRGPLHFSNCVRKQEGHL